VIALATSGMVFSIRTAIMLDLENVFFAPIDPLHSAGLVTAVAGMAFMGLAIAQLIGAPLCDYVGMSRLLGLASVLHIGGALVIILSPQPQAAPGGPLGAHFADYWALWVGMLTVGLAHGLVEATINPLIATLYPDDKTHKLNLLHAWWPGGLIIGGLVAYGLGRLHVGWQVKQGVIILPALIYGLMLIRTKFPPTERLAAGVSGKEMWKQALKPLFIVWFLCMFLTASSELGPGQWVDSALTRTVHFQGILLLVYVSGLMFVMRHFAGPLARRLSPVGLMWLSALLAGIGLLLLGAATSPVGGLIGATVWGIGVCYMWPTMLGVTSERFPKGGATLLGLMGTAGNLSVYLVLPKMGTIFDIYKAKAAEGLGTTFDALSQQAADKLPGASAKLTSTLSVASSYSFKWVAVLPALLLIVFGIIWLRDRAMGGYKAVKLTAEPEPAPEKKEQAPV